MENHPITDLFKISLELIKDMIDVNTICGEAIKISENTSVIPISKVKCTFATGGTEQSNIKVVEGKKYPFGGGTGGALVLNPIAFLVINNDEIRLLHLNDETHIYEKIIDAVPTAVSTIKDFFKKEPKVKNIEVIEKNKLS